MVAHQVYEHGHLSSETLQPHSRTIEWNTFYLS